MAIHPRYAMAILQGRKLIEFRKRPLARNIKYVAIYATSPISQIVGVFSVADVEVEAPSRLWQHYSSMGSIERPDYDAYYGQSATGTAILIGRAYRLASPVKLKDIDPALPVPQSFYYLRESAAGAVMNLLPEGWRAGTFVASFLDDEMITI